MALKIPKKGNMLFWLYMVTAVCIIGICILFLVKFKSKTFEAYQEKLKVFVEKSWINSEGKDTEYLHVFDDSYTFVNDIQRADVVLQNVHASRLDFPRKIMYAFEPNYVTQDWWSSCKVVVVSHKHLESTDTARVIYYPFGFFYLNAHNYLNDVLHRNKRIATLDPRDLTQRKFCIFINSNSNATQRIEFCKKLMEYKHVDCPGAVLNNCPRVDPLYFTHEFRNHLRQYKFMICFENSDYRGYFTEKPMNAYLGDTVPIYWSNPESQEFFNEKSMVLLKEFNDDAVQTAIQRIKELDSNDELYLQTLREPLLKNNTFPEEFSVRSIQEQVNRGLLSS